MTINTQYTTQTERQIARALITRLLLDGKTISVKDGADSEATYTVKRSKDQCEIETALATTGEDVLVARDADGALAAWFLLIWGNDDDLLSDCSANDYAAAVTAALN